MVTRFLKHSFTTTSTLKRQFSPADLTRIETAVRDAEANHDGQIRVVLEAALSLHDIRKHHSVRGRAMEVFALEHVWDTAHNTGVLIYVLWADRRVEIIADRGIHARHGEATWQTIANAMQAKFQSGSPVEAVLTGIEAVKAVLPKGAGSGELPNRPALI